MFGLSMPNIHEAPRRSNSQLTLAQGASKYTRHIKHVYDMARGPTAAVRQPALVLHVSITPCAFFSVRRNVLHFFPFSQEAEREATRLNNSLSGVAHVLGGSIPGMASQAWKGGIDNAPAAEIDSMLYGLCTSHSAQSTLVDSI